MSAVMEREQIQSFWIPIDQNVPRGQKLMLAHINDGVVAPVYSDCLVEELPINEDAALFSESDVPSISFDGWPYETAPDPTHYHVQK